jgi:hypothetical protein
MIIGAAMGCVVVTAVTVGASESSSDAQPAAAVASHAVAAPDAITATPVEHAEQPTISLEFRSTRAIEPGRANTSFGRFVVTSNEDIAGGELIVDGTAGARPIEAVGHEYRKSGDGIVIELGDLAAGDELDVIVAFQTRNSEARFEARTSYSSLHGDLAKVAGPSAEFGLATATTNKDVYEYVRVAYSEQALEEGIALRDAGTYKDGLQWVDQTYADNADVGRALRISSRLVDYQNDLDALRAELLELSKPKPKKVRKAKPKKTIEIEYGSRS